ncbi:MAG: DNA repair protein RecO [Bacteroidales bacterium]|jgi:DNA repair protein RecO (recombination protein O)
MLVSSDGIVINYFDYSETSIICKIFTSEFGLKSYIAKGVRKQKSKFKRNLFTPLNLVNIIAYQKKSDGLLYIRDINQLQYCNEIATNINKVGISVYMCELLSKTLQPNMQDKDLFEFIKEQILFLDNKDVIIGNYPLFFAAKLTQHLGCFPLIDSYSENTYFNLLDGRFGTQKPNHMHYTDTYLSQLLHQLFYSASNNQAMTEKINSDDKKRLFEAVHDYYKIHIPNFGEIKSYKILSATQ